jgi:hypothetical protein
MAESQYFAWPGTLLRSFTSAESEAGREREFGGFNEMY